MSKTKEPDGRGEPRGVSRALADRALTRRTMLKGSATAGAVALGAAWGGGALAGGRMRGATVHRDDILMLVNRLSYGQTEKELNIARSLGYDRTLKRALYPGVLNDSVMEAFIAPAAPHLDAIPADYYSTALDLEEAAPALQQSALARQTLTKYQAHERLFECWSDHFNMYVQKNGVEPSLARSHRDVLRPHSTGTFEGLLEATMQDPCMMIYLDNNTSTGATPDGVNENYARELLELHTMSPSDKVTGAPTYSEDDVRALAEILSGWRVDSVYNAASPDDFLSFQYSPSDHVTGDKWFLNDWIYDGGMSEGLTAGQRILNRADTARFVAYKLARFFLSYDPDPALIDSVATIYGQTTPRGDIRQMVKAILDRPNIIGLTSGGVQELKLRRPKDFVVALARATNPDMDNTKLGLRKAVGRLGNLPFEWAAPDGYPDAEGAWIDAIFGRWEVASYFFADPADSAQQGVDGLEYSDAQLAGLLGAVTSWSDVAQRISVVLTGGVMSTPELSALVTFMQQASTGGVSNTQVVRDAFALAASFPTFQYY